MRQVMRAFVLMVVLLGWAGGAMAVDLPQNRPTKDRGALEQKLQSQTQLPTSNVQGFVHIPDQKEGVLVQPLGRTFRDVRTKIQPWFDAAMIVIAVLAMAALYLIAGPMRYTQDPEGRTIKRFTAFERFIHWMMAASFIWLSVTGLNMVFGRHLLQPVIGDNAFASLSALLKLSHNAVAYAFMLALVVMSTQWLHNNIPSRLDIVWIKMAGGMFGGPHPPARKFNAGQKMIYWIAVFGGGAISLTGLALLLPFYAFDIGGQQIMHGAHSIIAALMIATIIGHIYLGSIGVPGSFQAMVTGRVDLNWAKEHHGLWVQEEIAKGHVPPEAAVPMHPAE
jgi:formate dehydrogenase subunit gamma